MNNELKHSNILHIAFMNLLSVAIFSYTRKKKTKFPLQHSALIPLSKCVLRSP